MTAAAPVAEVESTAPAALSSYVIAVLVGAGVATSVWLSTQVRLDPVAHRWVLFAHLACVVRVRARGGGPPPRPIWGGYAGLVATGALLSPDLSSRLTLVKVGLVLVIGCNGAAVRQLHQHVAATAGVPRPAALLASGGCVAVSQLGWWGATVIGFANAR